MYDTIGNDHNLLRKESFGGTLFLVQKGIRAYINQKEYQEIISGGSLLTPALVKELGTSSNVIIKEPAILPANNFSIPDTVYLEVTRVCNLRCSHCFNNSGKKISGQLTRKQFELIIDDLAENGVQEIRFTGGEPLVFDDIMFLIKKTSMLGLRTSIGTNATLIDAKMANILAENGLHSAIVSLDGLERHNDRIRGSGAFKGAISGINHLKKNKIDVRVNTVVMRSNFEEVVLLVDFLFNENIPIFIRRLIVSGRAINDFHEMLSEDEYQKLNERLGKYFDQGCHLVDGHYLSRKPLKTRIALPFLRNACSVGQRGLVILPDGRIQTCGFLGPLGEPSLGNISTESLSDIWHKLNNSDHVKKLENNLHDYNNNRMASPETNCLAIALSMRRCL